METSSNPRYTEIPYVALDTRTGEKTVRYPTEYGACWEARSLRHAAEATGKAIEAQEKIRAILKANPHLRVEVEPVITCWGWNKGDEDIDRRDTHDDSLMCASVYVSCDAHPELEGILTARPEGAPFEREIVGD